MMDRPEKTRKESQSFSRHLMLWMIVLVLCMVGFLTINDYLYTSDAFNNDKEILRIQTEQNVEQALRFKDALWTTYDTSLNNQMKAGLTDVLAEYDRSGRDPSRMDLAAVKEKIGSDYDIYVIDESGVIIYTTFAPELGWDFKKIPQFYEYLTKIRLSEGFFPDHIVNEMGGEGKFRKYAYMPTPDHKYLLELGLTGQSFENIDTKINVNDNIDSIMAVNPYVQDYRIFNALGRESVNQRLPEQDVQARLAESLKTRTTTEYTDPVNSLTIRYLFVDLKDPLYGSDPSRIIEITYSDQKIQEALSTRLFFHLLIGSAALFIGCAIAFILSRRITRPVQDIVEDVEKISQGELDHRIRPTENREFAQLESSINLMVDNLKAAMVKMRDDEIFKNEVIDQLPVGVFIKRVDDGRYIFWNKTLARLFQLPAEGIVGKTDREVFPERIVLEIEREDHIIINNPHEMIRKIQMLPSENGTVLHSITVPILDSKGNLQYILGICEDVSHENLNLKKDLLFSLVRHEILDHLSVIMNHLERAQLKSNYDEMQVFFDKTIGSIGSIKNQISSMRTLQDCGLITPKWQSVRDTFDDAVHFLPKNSVHIENAVDDVEILADPLLSRVFYKLLDFSFRNGGKNLTSIRLSAKESGGTLNIFFQDDSPGVPDGEKEVIFTDSYPNSLYLARELLAFTGIGIREIGVYRKNGVFNIQVPGDRFRHP